MLQIVCVDSHNYCGRGADYVRILHDSVWRNLPDLYPGKFVCFSDYRTEYGPGIEVRPLPGNLGGWWNKLWLFKPGLFPDGDRLLYLDLDTVLIGKLDEIVQYDGDFGILADAYRSGGLQSAVMSWQAGSHAEIWNSFETAGCPDIEGGDQIWIERSLIGKAERLNDVFPGQFASYKGDGCQVRPPRGASVIVFHGRPRPHEETDNWVPYVWKVGGGTTASLEVACNTDGNRLLRNVRQACARSLPWLEMEPARECPIVIAGSGPSLPETISQIPDDAPILALNAAATWVVDHVPEARVAQVILDARPEMADMVESRAIRHYLASQCAPETFDAVRDVKGNPILYHPNIPGLADVIPASSQAVHLIGGGSTVGLQAMVIAYVQGYRKIHLIGMDSSYRQGEGHAFPQSLNDGEKLIDVTVGDKTFQCAPWMAHQAEEFQHTAAELANLGCEIIVHGDGLLPAMAHELVRQHALAERGIVEPDGSGPCLRASEVVRHLTGVENPIGAEIGVFRGHMSRRLLGYRSDLTLYMVDFWGVSDPDSEFAASDDFHATLTLADQDRYAAEAESMVGFAPERARIIRKPSVEAAKDIPDGSLDFVFIDADHTYQGCKSDIEAWLPKLKPGALLSGHDYCSPTYPKFAVERAVDEFAHHHGLTVELGLNLTWFIRLPQALESAA